MKKQIKTKKVTKKVTKKDKLKKSEKKKEQYFICPYCSDLKTSTSILADCEMGGPGMCDCQFTTLFWNPEFQDLDADTPRTYHEYVEISGGWFDCLKAIPNDVLRNNALKQIPGIERLK